MVTSIEVSISGSTGEVRGKKRERDRDVTDVRVLWKTWLPEAIILQ